MVLMQLVNQIYFVDKDNKTCASENQKIFKKGVHSEGMELCLL